MREHEEELRRRARECVERTTAEQGVPLKVRDPAVLNFVGMLLLQARDRRVLHVR